jgi:TolA-binding protein
MRTTAVFFCLLAFIFVQPAPAAEEQPALSLYRQGKAHYDNDRFDQALAAFDRVVTSYPENPVAEYAANLSLDILNIKKDYAGLEKLARRYAADKRLMKHASLREVIEKLLPQIAYKHAQELFKAKKYPEAGEAFLKVAAEYPKSVIADGALYNAALSYEKARIKARAQEIHRRLIREHPKSPLARRSKEILKKFKEE